VAGFTAGCGRLLAVFGEIAGAAAMRALPALVLTAAPMLGAFAPGFRRPFSGSFAKPRPEPPCVDWFAIPSLHSD
jgi:hypothetical protein